VAILASVIRASVMISGILTSGIAAGTVIWLAGVRSAETRSRVRRRSAEGWAG